MGVLTGLIGILADLIAVNRRLLEKLLAAAARGPQRPADGPARAPSSARRPPERRSPADASGAAMPTALAHRRAIVAGNVYPKYTTRNPVARRWSAISSPRCASLVQPTGAREVHEVGCGEGHLSMLLAADGLRGARHRPVARPRSPRRGSAAARRASTSLRDRRSLRPRAGAGWRPAGAVLRGARACAGPGARARRSQGSPGRI